MYVMNGPVFAPQTSAIPADNITATTLADPGKAVIANTFMEHDLLVFLTDGEAGAKSVAFTAYASVPGAAEDLGAATGGVLDEADFTDATKWVSVKTGTVDLGAAAALGPYVAQLHVVRGDCSGKYLGVKAVVTHADPTASKVVSMAVAIASYGSKLEA